jgi:hypothetical protein
MKPQTPVIDVLIARDGDAWRLHSAPCSWRTPFSLHVDRRGDIFPVGRPDAANLEQFMFATDSPYEVHPTVDGGMGRAEEN